MLFDEQVDVYFLHINGISMFFSRTEYPLHRLSQLSQQFHKSWDIKPTVIKGKKVKHDKQQNYSIQINLGKELKANIK